LCGKTVNCKLPNKERETCLAAEKEKEEKSRLIKEKRCAGACAI